MREKKNQTELWSVSTQTGRGECVVPDKGLLRHYCVPVCTRAVYSCCVLLLRAGLGSTNILLIQMHQRHKGHGSCPQETRTELVITWQIYENYWVTSFRGGNCSFFFFLITTLLIFVILRDKKVTNVTKRRQNNSHYSQHVFVNFTFTYCIVYIGFIYCISN